MKPWVGERNDHRSMACDVVNDPEGQLPHIRSLNTTSKRSNVPVVYIDMLMLTVVQIFSIAFCGDTSNDEPSMVLHTIHFGVDNCL